MFTTKEQIPLVSTTKFNVPGAAAIAAGSGAYGTTSHAGTGDWILGSSMPKGRALLITCSTGAAANSPTYIKFGLLGNGTDANGGGSPDFITGAFTEVATPAGDTEYELEVDLNKVSDLTKYYSLGIAVNGASASATVIASVSARVLDPFNVTS